MQQRIVEKRIVGTDEQPKKRFSLPLRNGGTGKTKLRFKNMLERINN